MRRTIFLALLAALLFAPVARATPPIEIQRDCADDGQLQGDYSVADLRKARAELPTDADEYSDCRDVLSRAITKAVAASKTPTPTPATSGDSGGAGGSTSGGDNGAGGSSTPSKDTSTQDQQDAAVLAAPSSPQDAQAVGAAQALGEKQIKAELVARSPDQERLAASVGRNGLPTTMIAVLVLIAATLVAALLPVIRRRRDLPGHPST
ncbi:hypothetical protein [Solirubrobacter soli]|uniref:hypothetical protein n=1 Tax=Solirubrobacter soli TaxID=363832 RepID=UPI000422F073|nr:hypothetical protein [Solirubrobacter soli]